MIDALYLYVKLYDLLWILGVVGAGVVAIACLIYLVWGGWTRGPRGPRGIVLIALSALTISCSARLDRSESVAALAQLSLEAQARNAECRDAFKAKRIEKSQVEEWSRYVVGLASWSEGLCVRYDVAIPQQHEDLRDAVQAKASEVRQTWDAYCRDRERGRFAPAAVLAEPAARAAFAWLLDLWKSSQETPEERDRWWQRSHETVITACERVRAITPPVK